MPELVMNHRKWYDWVNPVAAVGMLVTVVTIFMSDHQQIAAFQRVLQAYEAHGTPAVVRMQATYDEHLRNNDQRMDRMESAILALQSIDSRTVRIEEQVKALRSDLSEHMHKTN